MRRAKVVFSNLISAESATVPATVDGDVLQLVLPTAIGEEVPGGVPGVPRQVPVTFSIDATGQIVVDVAAADGTMTPVWTYLRLE